MAAVKPVLQVNPCLSDTVISPHKIMVHDCDNQLRLQWERHCEFKYPEIQSQSDRQTDSETYRQVNKKSNTARLTHIKQLEFNKNNSKLCNFILCSLKFSNTTGLRRLWRKCLWDVSFRLF